MITREQLELAALAAGKRVAAGYVTAHDNLTAIVLESGEEWRPHTDPGDAARLAVRLEIDVEMYRGHIVTQAGAIGGPVTEIADHDGTEPDKLRAWCEAVTLCAEAVGEKMKGGA